MGAHPTDDDGWGDVPELEPAASAGETEDANAAGEPERTAEPEPNDDWGPSPSAPRDDGDAEPVPPPTRDESLAEAAGIDGDYDEPPPRRRRWSLGLSGRGRVRLIAAAIVAALLIVGGVVSWLNSGHLYIVCDDDEIRAERGSFFLWGRSDLGGDRFKPIPSPRNIGCAEQSFEARGALEIEFLDRLVDRANRLLEPEHPTEIKAADAILDQGLLLARAAERGEQRAAILRLQADIEYWRARGSVESAAKELRDAKETLDAIAGKTRHVRDAGSWAEFVGDLIERTAAGPGATPDPDRPPPLEPPTSPASAPDAGTSSAPAVDIPDAGPPVAKPDAAIPRGGVLL